MTGVPSETGFVYRELGKISATLTAMKEGQDEFQKESKEHRVEVNATLRDMDARISDLEMTSRVNSEVLNANVLPTVNKVKIWEQRGIGFLAFAGMAGTGFGAVLVKYGSEIADAFSSFFRS